MEISDKSPWNLSTIERRSTLKGQTTLETSGEDEKQHSKRVEKMKNNFETGGEGAKPHSKSVEKMKNNTRNEWRRSLLGNQFDVAFVR